MATSEDEYGRNRYGRDGWNKQDSQEVGECGMGDANDANGRDGNVVYHCAIDGERGMRYRCLGWGESGWVEGCAGCYDSEGDEGDSSFRTATTLEVRDVRFRPRPLPPVNLVHNI